MQSLDSCGALIERRFRFPLAPTFFHGAGIFSAAELSAQFFRPALANGEPNADCCDHDYEYSDSDCYLRRVYLS
jgi:hypothetical protein